MAQQTQAPAAESDSLGSVPCPMDGRRELTPASFSDVRARTKELFKRGGALILG